MAEGDPKAEVKPDEGSSDSISLKVKEVSTSIAIMDTHAPLLVPHTSPLIVVVRTEREQLRKRRRHVQSEAHDKASKSASFSVDSTLPLRSEQQPNRGLWRLGGRYLMHFATGRITRSTKCALFLMGSASKETKPPGTWNWRMETWCAF